MDVAATSLLIWQHHAAEIRQAYLDSESRTALVIAEPESGVKVSTLEFWAGGFTDPESDYGGADREVERCRREYASGHRPAAFFVVRAPEGDWHSSVMPLFPMVRGGSA